MDTYVYLILGCVKSGRREVLHDLVSDIASADDPFTILKSALEDPNEWDGKLANIPHVTIETYSKDIESISSEQFNSDHTNIILSPGLANPVDQVEALKPLLEKSSCELGRIITIVHCGLLESHKHLQSWYDACIHFSDACIIIHTPETPNQFMQGFIDRYKENHYPCLFEPTRKGRVKNPELILDPKPRRISLYFEAEEELWLDDDEDELDETEEDAYLAKLPGGKRKKYIADIESILAEESTQDAQEPPGET